ncbi:MAG: proteasome accessory factor PafA2 family protein, partial [Candidatus Nanopelagicales bacterium]|nr:proteasome accessory factor PafA2 family protein [Candidatus Nanopelagicales bacterium]
DLTLENPIRAIRDISRDLTGTIRVTLANGRKLTPLELQAEYFERAHSYADAAGLLNDPESVTNRVLELWSRTLKAVESGDFSLIDREIDWAIKLRLLDRYRARHSLTMDDARISQLDLAYHDISRDRGLYYLLERKGLVERVATEDEISEAKSVPPQGTRAKLRGDFIRNAQLKHRDFTVDWVHLKLNDQSARTVLCKDPFRAVDERVERLIAAM